MPEKPILSVKAKSQLTGKRTITASSKALIIATFAAPTPIAKESKVYITA